MSRRTNYLTVAACSALSVILHQSQAGNPPATTQPSVVGEYKAHTGDPKHDRFYSITVLNLKSDGAMASTLTMSDPQNADQKIVNKAEGKWTSVTNTLTLSVNTLNGKAIQADDPEKTLIFIISNDGKRLTNNSEGIEFIRQESP